MRQQEESVVIEQRPGAISLAFLIDKARDLAAEVLSPRDERTQARSNAMLAFSVRLLSAALLYLMQIVLARWMGSFEYGIYVFVWTWVLILGGLAPLGLNITTIRLAPEYTERGETEKLRGLTFGTRAIAALAGTAIALVGSLGLYIFAPYVANYYVLPAYLVLICIPLYAIGDVQDGIGRGKAWMGVALIPPYVLRPILILVSMFGAYLAGFPMTATTAAIAAILGTWITTLSQMFLLNRKLSADQLETEKAKSSRSTVQRHDATHSQPPRQFEYSRWLKISSPLLVINACELLLQNTDVLVISQYLSPEQVGIYFAAAKTMSLILFVHYAVGSAVANQFSALKARGDEEGLQAFVSDALHWTFWPSLAAAIALLFLGKPLLSLFGPEFATQGFPVMVILSIGFLIRSSVGPAEFLMNMLGEQRLCAAVLIATAILNLVLNLVLVPNFGLIGAAFATATSLSVGALASYIAVRTRLGLDLAIWKNLKRR